MAVQKSKNKKSFYKNKYKKLVLVRKRNINSFYKLKVDFIKF